MKLSYELLNEIGNEFGQTFYLLDTKQFELNYRELQTAFSDIYPNTKIAYSYKTNYTPRICKLVDQFGGLAEIVSDMEYDIAQKIGVDAKKIYFNGPYKDSNAVEELLITGGTVNLDSNDEMKIIRRIAEKHPNIELSIGIRCNFDIQDGVLSRFGFDVDGDELKMVMNEISQTSNVKLNGLHCHFAARDISTWPNRVEGILKLVDKYFKDPPKFISLGGGLYGKMAESLKKQFNTKIPTYLDYANVAAIKFKDFFNNINESEKPTLIIEPGSALVGDVMKFATKVVSIKDIRGKKIATVLGSIYNINPTLNKKNPPILIYHNENCQDQHREYLDLDFGGFTCIESDYLYRGFNGRLSVGDYVVFENVGSYSIVLKPPFILPNFSIVEYDDEQNTMILVKRREQFSDVFHTYKFEF